jgi:hypothetical protein
MARTMVVKADANQLPSRKRHSPILPILASGAVAAVVLVLTAAIASNRPPQSNSPSPVYTESYTEFTSTDGAARVNAPSDWTQVTGLNDNAQLQLKNSNGIFAILINVRQQDVAVNLSEYADINLKSFLSRTPAAQVMSGPTPAVVNGDDAIEYQLISVAGGENAIILYTFVKSAGYYHQLLIWAPKSVYYDHLTDILSFRGAFHFD